MLHIVTKYLVVHIPSLFFHKGQSTSSSVLDVLRCPTLVGTYSLSFDHIKVADWPL